MSEKDTILFELSPLGLLIDAANVTQRCIEKRLLHLRLGVAQQRILALIYLSNASLQPTMLAALLLQETHSISGHLNRLEDRNLIIRNRDRRDRRVVWVNLTSEGRRVAEEAIEIVLSAAREFGAALKAPRSDEMLEVVRNVRDKAFGMVGVDEATRREALRRVWA